MNEKYNTILKSYDKDTFKNLMLRTKNCMDRKGLKAGHYDNEADFNEALKCETAYFSDGNEYTFHTHPNGNPNPSEVDRNTNKRFKKKFMFIGLIPQNKVVVYDIADNFKKMVGSFSI